MDILFLLIPLSVLLVFALMAAFLWALQTRPFEDLDREGTRILADDVDLDRAQGPTGGVPRHSPPPSRRSLGRWRSPCPPPAPRRSQGPRQPHRPTRTARCA